MQQQSVQQMFEAADTNGDGTISQTEFENFYNKFMGTNSTTGTSRSSSTTAAADQLFQELTGSSGSGQMTQTQFASALKQMMSQKAQGNHHHHHGASADGTTSNGTSQSATSSSAASNNATTWLEAILAATNQPATGQSTASQNNGGIEFIA